MCERASERANERFCVNYLTNDYFYLSFFLFLSLSPPSLSLSLSVSLSSGSLFISFLIESRFVD